MKTRYGPSPARFAAAAAIIVTALCCFLPQKAVAAGAEPTAIAVVAPATATVGERVTVQARLASAAGPIGKAEVDFVVPTAFFSAKADMVVGRAITDGQGVAHADFEARMTGDLQVKAVFAGDQNYAASNASAPLSVTGGAQLYTPDPGVQLRGVTANPIGQLGHWALSGWPIAAALIVIWSLYASAVFFMSRIVADPEAAAMDAATKGVRQ